MFSGLSTLRTNEKKSEVKESEASRKLKDYLKKYEGGDAGGEGNGCAKKKRKKKKKATAVGHAGLVVVDEDISGFAAATTRGGASTLEDDDEDYQPVVVNQEAAERHMRVIEKEKERYKQREDGSGWRLQDSESGARRRHDSPEDLSPPRRKQQRHDSPEDLSPPRRQRHDSPEDLSPPRKQRHDSPEDLSPPRRKQQRYDSPEDLSPPRRQRNDSPEDLSPPRRRKDCPEDLSPPRRQPQAPQKMSDGTAAGMISGIDLKNELEEKKMKDRKRWQEMEASVSGRNAETVFRDESGKKYSSRSEYEAAVQQKKAEREKKHIKEADLEWGGGLTQKKKKSEMRKAMEAEAAKPFARSHDADVDAAQRDALRWGDPMAHLVAKRSLTSVEEQAPSLVDATNKKSMNKSGFIIPQGVPQHSWLRRGVGPPPNRYSIKPGRHWDGVDRSNGFESKMWKLQQKKAAENTEAFMWAQSDM